MSTPTLTVKELIEILNSVKDKDVGVFVYDPDIGDLYSCG